MSISKELFGEIQIIVSIIFFGMSFVGQRFAMFNGIGPLTFNAGRFFVSTTLLLVFRPYLQSVMDSEFDDGKDDASDIESSTKDDSAVSEETSKCDEIKELWWWGSLCGVSNFVGSVLQQVALVSVSVAKTGFITGMYVVAVPLVEMFIPSRRASVTIQAILAAITSMIGMYFLSGCQEGSECLDDAEGRGETLVFISMLCWVVSILASDAGSKKVDCISLTCVDFVICSVFNIILALVYEPEEWVFPYSSLTRNWLPIVVVGFTEAAAFLLSTLGQMYTPATRASLLMSLEAVSSALGGYLVLGETLTPIEIGGSAIMFLATLISSVDFPCLGSSRAAEEAEPLINLDQVGIRGHVKDHHHHHPKHPNYSSIDSHEGQQDKPKSIELTAQQ